MTDLIRSPRMAGNVVRKARLLRNWTQKELADRMRVRQATVSRLEAGNPGTRIHLLFDALAVMEVQLVASGRVSSVSIEDLF